MGETSGKPGRALLAHRLSARCGDDTWIGTCVRVFEAARREGSEAVEHTPDHYLAAAWAPGAPRSRWPDAVVIGSPAADDALALLLRHVPEGAKLFLADLDAADAALAARILLAADRNLEPYQRDGIAAFVAAEEARVASCIAAGYTDRDEGFERFRARVLDASGARS
ncbi:MAG: hypothetical protein KAX82_05770 [Burkholderiales bacterium]|nr:hypothetical protein [Burkholderiales bacterium]